MVKNGIIETSVVKESKIPNDWSLTVSKRYNQNEILGDLHREHSISSNFNYKNSVLTKNILVLISRKTSFSLLLILISKN